MSKKSAAIYKEAARGIAEGDLGTNYACVAVDRAGGSEYLDPTREREAFRKRFEPHGREGRTFSRYAWLQRTSEMSRDEGAVHRRVVALCFAAAMARTGDL